MLNKEDRVKKLKSEIATNLKISHPNLAKFYETHETDSYIYLVYECINGYCLDSVPGVLSLSPVFIAKIIYALLETLDYVFKSNIQVDKIAVGDVFFRKDPLFFGPCAEEMPLSNIIVLGIEGELAEHGKAQADEQISIGTGSAGSTPDQNFATCSTINLSERDIVCSLGRLLQSYLDGGGSDASETKFESMKENGSDEGEMEDEEGNNKIESETRKPGWDSWGNEEIRNQAGELIWLMLNAYSPKGIKIKEAMEHEFFQTAMRRYQKTETKDYRIDICPESSSHKSETVGMESPGATGKFFEMFIMSDRLNQEIFGYEDMNPCQGFQKEEECCSKVKECSRE